MLPFTADVLFSSFEQYNRALWSLPIVAVALALAVILLTLKPVRGGGRAIGALLAAAWVWIGVGYHYLHFATIDFAAPVYGVFFVVQGLLLAWTGVARGRLDFRFGADLFGWCGLALAIAAAVASPLADGLAGHGWRSVRVVGLAPGPTAAFTLGMLLLTAGRPPLHLAVIPLLWTLVAGAMAWVLAIPQDLALAAAGLGGFGLILWKNRQQQRA
ncbi:MAG: DUF6064 family protein [Geminicoccaceae bacterium]